MPPTSTTHRRHAHSPETPELTTDIILHHILPRLPVKSVFRLMTVSKEFHSFLNTRNFTKIHLRHQNYNKFLVLSHEQRRWLFSSVDGETLADCLVTPPPSRPMPFLANNRPPYMRVVASFHGLVCVAIFHYLRQKYPDLIVWNPFTGDYKVLSKPNFEMQSLWPRSFEGFGLYYSSCDDDYKLLYVSTKSRCDFYVYSLRSDSWRKLALDLETNFSNYFLCTPSVWLNESLYFLDKRYYSTMIIRFNTVTEKITVIKLPPSLGQADEVVCVSLFVDNGYIHICVRLEGFYRKVKYDTWRMNEDGDWSMVDTYYMDKMTLAGRLKMQPHLMRNGKWLMIHNNEDSTDFILNMFDPEKKAYTYTFMGTSMSYVPEEGRYTETLVRVTK